MARHFIPHTLTPTEKEEHEERAAILEFEAGLMRWAAELEAWKMMEAAREAREAGKLIELSDHK